MIFAFYRVTAVNLQAYTMPVLSLYVPVCIRHTAPHTQETMRYVVTLKVIGVELLSSLILCNINRGEPKRPTPRNES
jgi:hypothetical protein